MRVSPAIMFFAFVACSPAVPTPEVTTLTLASATPSASAPTVVPSVAAPAPSASAAGESLFELAEVERRRAEALAPPKFAGQRSKEALVEFIKKDLGAWLRKRTERVNKADEAYRRIVKLKVYAQPRWVIAGTERSASMWARLTDEFLASARASMPDEWRGNDVGVAYLQSLQEQVEPIRQHRVRPAYERCVRESEEFGAVSGHTEVCVKWLADNPLKEGGGGGYRR